MNQNDPNIASLEIVVECLGDLCKELVLVGGCSVGLLISDPASPPVRETIDVDLVAEVTNVGEYYQLGDKLAQRGFRQSAEAEHICRWTKGPLKIDVMPSSSDVLGHSTNLWYPEVVATAHEITLSNGSTVLVVSPPLFLATKLVAFYDRGFLIVDGVRFPDYAGSHDLEDIINVIDGRPELAHEVETASDSVRNYLRDEFDELLADTNFVDVIPMHLRTDAASQARASIVLERLRRLAGL